MEERKNELMVDDGMNLVADLTSADMSYCSMAPKNDAEKRALFKAMNNPDGRIADCINMDIKVKDIYVEKVNCINKETGEVSLCPRIVLIDTDGKSYQCVSIGMYSAIKKLIRLYGQPTWDKGITITIKQIKKSDRSILTFDIK